MSVIQRDGRSRILPLTHFPPEMQERIAELVALPFPPPRWLGGEMSQIPSQAYHEWYWQRGRRPGYREPIGSAVRDLIAERDRGICQLCGLRIEKDEELHIDHVLPVALGGLSHADNLQLAHATCNMRKGARLA